MRPIEFGKRRLYVLIAAISVLFLLWNLGSSNSGGLRYWRQQYHPPEPIIPDNEKDQWNDPEYPPFPPLHDFTPSTTSIPWYDQAEEAHPHKATDGPEVPSTPQKETPAQAHVDGHPIATLMREADEKWRIYEGSRSQSFRQTVEKYRSKYGRHPPPGFKEWYIYARQKDVFNIDDFDHIMDDLRPFWALDPKVIRTHAAHMWENHDNGVSGIHVRNGKVARISHPAWRSETMSEVIALFAKHLPDMDILMNLLDQPRLLVPWEDLQAMLSKEHKNRMMPPEVTYNFTTGQDLLTNLKLKEDQIDEMEERLDAGWFGHSGKQYMEIARKACPPESPARSNMSIAQADAMYKETTGGIVTNFNLSSDLCTVGPAIQDLHGMLFSASSITASHQLLPIFSECKVNVNNDIMFPANMYWRHDDRYDYKPDLDVAWRDKNNTMIWRGVTSGGAQVADNWQKMHRQRLVQLMNGTYVALEGKTVGILTQDSSRAAAGPFDPSTEPDVIESAPAVYRKAMIEPSAFAKQVSDVGFVQSWGCIPNCSFYDDVFSFKPQTSLTEQFGSKYLIDVDGHSFSGRWHAFLLSKSLGFKATIFREWHDSRLFAWRHFVPVDNRYDDLYSLLTYFVGYGSPPQSTERPTTMKNAAYIPPHQEEAKRLARQGREWANKVLRRDDIEVYMFRLLLEYGRIIDDNRDRIGYSGDGSELDRFDAGEQFADDNGKSKWGIGGWLGISGAGDKKPKHGVGS